MISPSVWATHYGSTEFSTPCGWYRIVLPFGELRNHGWDARRATSSQLPPPESEKADIFVMQGGDRPEAAAVLRKRAAFQRLVYETDDDYFNIPRAIEDAYAKYIRPDVRAAIAANMRACDIVTVTTETLAASVREHAGHPDVRVLPNCIPDGVLDLIPSRLARRTVIGWTGSGGRDQDFAVVRDAVIPVLETVKRTEMHFMGTDYRHLLPKHLPARHTHPTAVSVDWRAWFSGYDFSIALAPLADIPFNRARCVDSSVRIATDRGVLEAGALLPGMQVWHDGWRKIEAAQHDVPRPGVLVTVKDGYQLRLTSEHRMMVNGGWTRADQITSGDLMSMEPEWTGPQDYVRVPWPADSRMSRAGGGSIADPDAFLAATDGPYLSITPRWGRILGAFAGDGSCSQATQVRISCDGKDQDWIDLLTRDFRACGLNPLMRQHKTFNGTLVDCWDLGVASAHLVRVLVSLGAARTRDNGKPVRTVCVPDVIWRSPRDVIAEFLAGYFEADGTAAGQGAAVTTKDEQMARDVQRLLLLFGITSALSSALRKAHGRIIGGHYWKVTLRRAEADLFEKEIGFRSARKRARLAEITAKPHSNAYRPIRWSREVTSVERCMVDPVDIQVEGHVFAAAGFTSHNSGLKAIEAFGMGIPVLASDLDPYRGLVTDGVNGYLCRTPDDWAKRLRELTCDRAAREEMGTKARETARAHVISAGVRNWDAAYRSLL